MRLYRAGRRAVRFLQSAQIHPQRAGGESSAAGSDFHAFRCIQALCRGVHGGTGVHQDWRGWYGKCVVLRYEGRWLFAR